MIVVIRGASHAPLLLLMPSDCQARAARWVAPSLATIQVCLNLQNKSGGTLWFTVLAGELKKKYCVNFQLLSAPCIVQAAQVSVKLLVCFKGKLRTPPSAVGDKMDVSLTGLRGLWLD